MAVNPKDMFKMRERLGIFQSQHPKLQYFFNDVAANALEEGSVVEMKVTSPGGREYVANIRLTKEDIETIEMVRQAR